jgi:AhpD family alkylhydroperoxidase
LKQFCLQIGKKHAVISLLLKEEPIMVPRLDIQKTSPVSYNAMYALSIAVRKSSKLERSLIELVDIRASQLNGCAYCIDMHTIEARAGGESEQRLYALNAWRETPFFTDRERAALAWTEVVTLISENHIPDEAYEQAKKFFSEEELVNLTLAIVAINGWNRLLVAFRAVPGKYTAGTHKLDQSTRA